MFLAQVNIAMFRWPLSDPRMIGFVRQIEPVNAIAEQSDGFVWRYRDQYVPRATVAPWDSPLLFFNMSVWRDAASLRQFVDHEMHQTIMQERARWTRPVPGPAVATWWIDEEARPSVEDAIVALSAN